VTAILLTVAVPTFRRNDHLRELLPMLVEQAEDLTAEGDVDARVLIVDNDPDGGAQAIVLGATSASVHYVHERQPGLAAVRNRAMAESGSSRLLAFMDDDGRPAPGWLRELVRVWRLTQAAAVAGRVVEQYEVVPDPWIVAGGFFTRRSLETFTPVEVAPTTNLLLDLDQARVLGLCFDTRFGLSGGEDTFFSRQLTAAGGRIVWCDESRVLDQVPVARATRRWVLTRAWSHGNTSSVVNLAIAASPRAVRRARARALGAGSVRVVGGGIRALFGVLTRSAVHQAKGLRAAFRGAGMISGGCGHVVEEYRR